MARISYKFTRDFIHGRETLRAGDVLELTCDTQCNFMLLTDSNLSRYRSMDSFTKHGGGGYRRFPARIVVPSDGDWNWVIDIGNGRATIRYSVRVIRRR